MDDQALIVCYHNGDEEACAVLLARYANLINKQIRHITVNGIDNDDLRQEAYMGLYNAIRSFDSTKNVSFASYASRCVGNSIKNLFAAASTGKAKAYHLSVPIDELENVDLRGIDDTNPEDILLHKEAYEDLNSLIDSVLSGFEKEVLFAYLSGRDYQEAAVKLHSSLKSVDNALQRARRKLKAVLNDL